MVMKRYSFRCPCGFTVTLRINHPPTCKCCDKTMKRDYKADSVTPTYHPTKGA